MGRFRPVRSRPIASRSHSRKHRSCKKRSFRAGLSALLNQRHSRRQFLQDRRSPQADAPPILHHSPAVQSTSEARFCVPSPRVVFWGLFSICGDSGAVFRLFTPGLETQVRLGRADHGPNIDSESVLMHIERGFRSGRGQRVFWGPLGLPWIQTPQGLGFARSSKMQPVGGVLPTGVLVFRRAGLVNWRMRW